MTKEYIKQLCEMLLKDNLTQNGKRKIVNYIDNLQQRIDKAIKYLEKFIPIDIDTIILRERQREYVVSILKGEEVKDNEC